MISSNEPPFKPPHAAGEGEAFWPKNG